MNQPDQIKRVIFLIAAIKFLFHLYIAAFAGYGIFRDELYYVACSNHMAFGYVDHPPFSIWIMKIFTSVFGDSVFSIRLIPALAGAVSVIFLGKTVRELGGGLFAVAFACICFLISPINLAFTSIFSMNVFDLLFWTLTYYLLVRIIKTENEKLWIYLGVLLGFALLNKISILFLGAGIFVALLATPQRKWFKTKWPYLTGIIAFLIFSPYILWNITHDWAHLEFIERATGNKYSGLSAWSFLSGQFLINHPSNFLVWLLGLGYFLFSKHAKEFRALGIVFVVTTLILMLNGNSKSEYLAGAIIILFAGGSLMLENWIKNLQWLKVTLIVFQSIGILIAPLAAPVLSAEGFISFSSTLGLSSNNNEGKEEAELPQFYADMHGWEQKAKAVSEVYSGLDPAEQENTVIFTGNYGRAGCFDYYRKDFPLPPSYSGHNNYWYWGPEEGKEINTVILMQGEIGDTADRFESVENAGTISCTYCMPYENNLQILICRGPKFDIHEAWPDLKHYD